MTVDPRTPCLIGWSTVSRFDGEPLEAWAEAARGALGDVAPGAVDGVDVVYCQSWPYDDPAGRLAEAIGAEPAHRRYSGIGGTTPQVLVADAAERILAGGGDVALVVGGEQLDTVRRLKKAGERPAWSHRDPEKKPFPFEAPFHPAELAHQVFQAYTTFAMWDVARRAHLGVEPKAYRRGLGELFAPMTAVAAANPDAWFREERSVDDVVEPTADNRMVAYPYTKRLVSVMDVDLTAAVVLASHEAADRLGVPADHRVYLRGSAYRTDPVYVAEHDEPWRSPGMEAAFGAALAGAGAGIDDVAHLDLYSCFPSSVSFALDALGLAADDRRAPFTVTGGLPYFGGAGSCYVVASIAAMADVLVADPGSLGMATGVGMHLTKHAAGIWSTSPPAPGDRIVGEPDPGPAVVRPIVDVHHGPATIAAYTVHHGRDGGPTDGLVLCDVADAGGARCYGVVRDAELLVAMEGDEWVGRTVELVDGGEGANLVQL
jgi:acetyl-CoA C-acetyltransferase